MQKTFVIIKPDAIQRGLIGKIISRFENIEFSIVKIEMKQMDEIWYNRMYCHLSRIPYEQNEKFMLSAPIIGIVIKGVRAIDRTRRMIGNTVSALANPGTIRGDYGMCPTRFNCIHASDSEVAVNKEIALFFGENY